MSSKRREFFKSSSALALSSAISPEIFADFLKSKAQPNKGSWDQGTVRHILPTVNDTQILIKVSFNDFQSKPPILKIGTRKVIGKMEDTQGECWSFYQDNLVPNKEYLLNLSSSSGKSLCETWPLKTFPAPQEQTKNFRLFIYTCAGGHEMHGFLPSKVRNQLLKRGLSFKPDAVIANGDHVYWDLLAPVGSTLFAKRPESIAYAGS